MIGPGPLYHRRLSPFSFENASSIGSLCIIALAPMDYGNPNCGSKKDRIPFEYCLFYVLCRKDIAFASQSEASRYVGFFVWGFMAYSLGETL